MSEENPFPASSQEETSTPEEIASAAPDRTDEESQTPVAPAPDETDEKPQESATPAPKSLPELLEEPNGGPLGCCLGITIGVMLGLLIGLIGFANFGSAILTNAFHGDPLTYVRIATAVFGSIGVILGGPIGWKIGKRIYRVYDESVVTDRKGKSKPMPKSAR